MPSATTFRLGSLTARTPCSAVSVSLPPPYFPWKISWRISPSPLSPRPIQPWASASSSFGSSPPRLQTPSSNSSRVNALTYTFRFSKSSASFACGSLTKISGFAPGFRFVRRGRVRRFSSLHSQFPTSVDAGLPDLSAAAAGWNFASMRMATSSSGSGAALSSQRKPHSSARIPMPIARKSRMPGFLTPFAIGRSSFFRMAAQQPRPPTSSNTARQDRTKAGKSSGQPSNKA